MIETENRSVHVAWDQRERKNGGGCGYKRATRGMSPCGDEKALYPLCIDVKILVCDIAPLQGATEKTN